MERERDGAVRTRATGLLQNEEGLTSIRTRTRFVGSSIAAEEGCQLENKECSTSSVRRSVPERDEPLQKEQTCNVLWESQSKVLFHCSCKVQDAVTCLMRRKEGRYFGMCARSECKLQVELSTSLTLYKETMYIEKANSVSSCVLGQTHENMVNAAQKGIHNSDH